MQDKDQFDALMNLAEFSRIRRNTRYQTQLRISIGLWASMATAIVYLEKRPPEVLLILALVAVSILHAAFMERAFLRNWHDMKAAFYYRNHAEDILSGKPLDLRNRPKTLKNVLMERCLDGARSRCFGGGFVLGNSDNRACTVGLLPNWPKTLKLGAIVDDTDYGLECKRSGF